MLRVLIIEDEPPAARRLERLLLQLEPGAQVLDTLDTVRSATAWLSTREADLIFLDIHLADGNSFSIFEQTPVRTPVIFTTAYDQYALRAFRLNSVDYLLKPVEKEELARSLAKFRELRSAPPPLDVAALLEAMKPQQAPAYQQRFLVQAGEKLRSVPVEEVSYFYGQQKFVFLITRDNRRHLVDYTLGELEGLLDPAQFYRINRQFIVSYGAIGAMHAWSRSRIKLDLQPPSDEEAIVSIEKTPGFKAWLGG